MWHQLEPVHAVFWYASEVFAEAAALGMYRALFGDLIGSPGLAEARN
jgi:hypothetical protein